MGDRVLNRINSARKTLGCLDEPAHKLIWQNQAPVIFTTKVGEASTLLDALLLTGQNQEKSTTGTTADKGREERELEDAAHTMGQALVTCCTDGNDLTTAAPFKMNITQWRVLRDEQLLAKAHALADAVAGVIAAGPAHASQYGLDTLTHSQLLNLKRKMGTAFPRPFGRTMARRRDGGREAEVSSAEQGFGPAGQAG